MSKTRILEIINSAAIGGGTRHLWDLITFLDGKGFSFEIIISDDGPYAEKFRKAGFPVHIVDMMSSRMQKKSIQRISRIAADVKPDLIHAHGTRAAFFLTRGMKKNFTIPTLYTVHGLSYNKNTHLWKRVFYRQVERYICDKISHVISVSEYDGKEMTKNEIVKSEKLSVIKNGINFDNLLKMPIGRKSPLPLGTIARLTRQKGLIHLIDAMVILSVAFELEPELIIVGDGPLRRKLEVEVFKYGISHRVKFEGSIEDTVPYYKKFGTFILPSMWEGLPLVLLEAMAAGLPVISTNTSGVLDVIEDEKDGLVVEKGNAEALALEIKRLMDEPELAKTIAENARKKVVMEYSVEKFAKTTADLYKKMINSTN